MSLRTVAKRWGLQGLRSTGMFSLASRSPYRNHRLLILCYHGISLKDEHQWSRHLYIAPQQFRQRLELLREFNANVLPLAEALRRLRSDSLPPRSVSITFDDGFHDFYRHGWPLLREFGYPCTVYLTTHYCDYPVPVFNLIVNYLFWKSGRPELDLSVFGLPESVPVASYGDRERAIGRLFEITHVRGRIDTEGKNELAARFSEQLGFDYGEFMRLRMFRIMTPEEVVRIAGEGCDIQLHTHRHRTPSDRTLFLRELADNSRRIAELTGRVPVDFCYPSGHHRPEFLPWLAEAGVKSATTCDPGLAAPQSAPLLLPRMLDDSRIETVEFESWLAGVRV